MVTGKELYELSKIFMEKCDLKHNKDGCDCLFCDSDTKKMDCPEFFFDDEESANKMIEFLGVIPELDPIVGEAVTTNKFSSPNFVDCTFNDCEISHYGME